MPVVATLLQWEQKSEVQSRLLPRRGSEAHCVSFDAKSVYFSDGFCPVTRAVLRAIMPRRNGE